MKILFILLAVALIWFVLKLARIAIRLIWFVGLLLLALGVYYFVFMR